MRKQILKLLLKQSEARNCITEWRCTRVNDSAGVHQQTSVETQNIYSRVLKFQLKSGRVCVWQICWWHVFLTIRNAWSKLMVMVRLQAGLLAMEKIEFNAFRRYKCEHVMANNAATSKCS